MAVARTSPNVTLCVQHIALPVLYTIQVNAGLQQMKANVVFALRVSPCSVLLFTQNISSLVTGMLRN